MYAFARDVVRSLNAAIHSGHYTAAESFKRILPRARALVATISQLSTGSNPQHRVGHTMLSVTSPDLPYDVLATYITETNSKDINCYTTGIINVGTYDKRVAFRFKYLVRGRGPSFAIRLGVYPMPNLGYICGRH
jgi:hypothetical protein